MIGKVLLALSGCLVALFLMEGLVRVLDLPPRPLAPLPVADYQLSGNPVIAYEYRPGVQPDDSHFDRSHRGFATNGEGFRDREYPLAKSPGTYRILVLGDSTTAGNGISELEQTYPKQLERLLNTGNGANPRYEVLNMGVGGYHTLQEAETLRVKGLRYAPDLVVITVCLNDFSVDSDGGVYARLRERDRLASRSAAQGLYDSLLRHSRLAFILHYRLLAAREASEDEYTARILQGRSPVRAGLELLSELQRTQGFRAVVLVLPAFDAPFDQYRHGDLHDQVRQAAAGLPGITLIDLLPRFAAVSSNAAAFAWDDLHMNELGHQTLAELLVPVVAEAR